MYQGKIVKWNEQGGYGFIKSDSFRENVFFHISRMRYYYYSQEFGTIRYGEWEEGPLEGDLVVFEAEEADRGFRAIFFALEGDYRKAVEEQKLDKQRRVPTRRVNPKLVAQS